MMIKILFCLPFVAAVCGLCAYQIAKINPEAGNQEPRWYNSKGFEIVDPIDKSSHDLEFDNAYTSIIDDKDRIRNCCELLSLGDNKIEEKEYARWDLLKTDCEVAKRFHFAPDIAVSHWPSTFDFALLKTFPSTSTPYLGGQGLDGRNGNLDEYESTLILIESEKHSIKVSYDGMVVNYVLMARGDFNRDGYQDIFVRMDWYIEGTFGVGHDWVVLTKISPNSAPIMLWRK